MWKQMLKLLGAHRAYLPVLVGLLVLTFVLTAVLAYSAQDADRRHRQAAEAALQDYTELAAEAYSVRLTESIVNGLGGVLVDMSRRGLLSEPKPTPEQLGAIPVDSLLCACIPDGAISTRIFLDGASGAVVQTGEPLTAASQSALRRTLESMILANITREWSAGWVLLPQGGRVYAAIVKPAGSGSFIRAFAYQLDDQVLALFARNLFHDSPLLFAESSSHMSNESLFGLAVSTTDGVTLFDTGIASGSHFTAVRELPSLAGNLHVRLVLRAGAADMLIPGGMPRPRLPFLLMILGVTGLSLVGAIFVLRRESELMRMRSDFVASVSHELRTPLAQIRMFTETLLLGRVRSDIERRRALEIIEQEARRLAHLVENVLTFGRSTQRRASLAPEPTSFADEVQRIVASFATLRDAQNAEIRMELQEEIVVPLDSDALRQIMINLVDNALKYGGPNQRITIGTALFGDAARLWVDDEGLGVPLAERERVFESFHRLSRDVDHSVTGSGIGLAVVRELTRLHGGSTWIEDAPGGGARVVAEFPGAYVRGAETAEGWAVA